MITNLHYGFAPNNHVCSCGRHYGYGTLTAEQRAERARGMREKLPAYMTTAMKAFLYDWEKHHTLSVSKPASNYRAYAD